MGELLKFPTADWGEVCVVRVRDSAEFYLSIEEATELIRRLPEAVQATKVAERARAEEKVTKCEQRLQEARKYLEGLE